MDSDEFSEWMAYDRTSPIGDARTDLLFALLASVVANVHTTKKDKSAFTPEDFLPGWARPEPDPEAIEQERQQGQQRIIATMLGLARASGGAKKKAPPPQKAPPPE